MLRNVQYENHLISYDLTYKDVRNINLRIRPDSTVSVSANQLVPVEKIDTFVISKGKYIVNILQKFSDLEQYAPKPKKYVSGESFKLLGRDLRLKVIKGNKEKIETDGVYIFLTVKNKADYDRKYSLVTRWLSSQCKQVFNEVVDDIYGKFEKYGVVKPKLCIREMISRWGSCQPKRGVITLNTRLIEVPLICIEYVVLHEFCHYIQPNHSKKFYTFIQMMMPDWKDRKKILESREYYIGNTITE